MAARDKKKSEAGDSGELDFEQAMAQLEETVRSLESGDVPLEESLRAFERGVALVRLLHERLDSVQQKIEELVRGADGEIETKALD